MRESPVLIFHEQEVDSLIELLNQAKLDLAEERRVSEENDAN
ncbi:hypothetical protein [Pseudomonas asplenii]|nr:hypothetical protein [Pseudomonas asplenii]